MGISNSTTATVSPSSTTPSNHHRPTTATYLFVLCAALNSCNLGYDIGVSTDAAKLIQEELGLTNHQREIFIGSINFWAIFGAIFAHFFTDGFGRRYTFVVAAVWFIVGILIMVAASSYELLLFGRVFVGLGVGIGLAIDPLYIAEIAPSSHRGQLVTYSEIAINVGIVLGFASGLVLSPLSDGKEWRLMLLCGAIMPVIMIILVFRVMPESPRWLLSKGRTVEARRVLAKVHDNDHVVQEIVQEIESSIRREEVARHAVGWRMICQPSFRRMIVIGVGTAISQQVVGIDAIQYYMLDVIGKGDWKSETIEGIILILLGVLKLVFICVGGALFDRTGRRPLFFWSVLGMAFALLMIGIAFSIDSTLSKRAVVLGLAVYLGFFSIGMGPGAWLIPSEVFPLSIRGKAMSLATLANRITATLMSSTFLSTAAILGWSGFFFMLFVVCLIVLSFLYLYLPETKGRTLEEMTVYFAQLTGDTTVLEAEDRVNHQYNTVEVGPSVTGGSNNTVPGSAMEREII